MMMMMMMIKYDLKGNGGGLIEVLPQNFPRELRKTTKTLRISNIQTEFSNRVLAEHNSTTAATRAWFRYV
jgi:hypothetical protein